ncbi:MCE family protein [Mycobacterium sp. SMC-19]|uniref:MCE family protein n=1 Tax=Mycobacterium sp. SMC-19 TaxID=3381630 RepID=UPI003875CE68
MSSKEVPVRNRLASIFFRVSVFVIVCVLGTLALLAVFGQFRPGGGTSYVAEFINASGLKNGNFVRIAGVESGKVQGITINPDATVRVRFSVDPSVTLTEATRAEIRYDDLIGGRYLALDEGTVGAGAMKPGQTIPVARTKPALDLDSVTGGFRPLLQGVDSAEINALSSQLMSAFQGQGDTIGLFLSQAAAVTNSLADRDLLVGELVANLDVVLGTLGGQSDQLDKAVFSLSELMNGLAARKMDVVKAVAHINGATSSVADLLSRAREPLQKVVHEADRTAATVLLDHEYFDDLLNVLPDKYRALNRQAIYGDYFSFYFCDVLLKLNGKGGDPVYVKLAGQSSGRCTPK